MEKDGKGPLGDPPAPDQGEETGRSGGQDPRRSPGAAGPARGGPGRAPASGGPARCEPWRAAGTGGILVTLEKAAFGYGGSPVVRGIDLAVRRGDFLGLVGPNGAGKTTLLRGVIGLLKPIEGSVRFHSSPGRRPVLGYVPQVQALDPIFPLTVEEVTAMGAFGRLNRLGFVPGREKAFAGECLARVGMDSFRKRLFADLSAGQKQRILIARALATRPDLLLLDEPTSGVDQAAESAIVDLLGELNASGIAVVLVCHEMDMVRRCVRDVVWVNRGRIERGSVEEMLSAAMVRERLETGG